MPRLSSRFAIVSLSVDFPAPAVVRQLRIVFRPLSRVALIFARAESSTGMLRIARAPRALKDGLPAPKVNGEEGGEEGGGVGAPVTSTALGSVTKALPAWSSTTARTS